MRWPFRKRKKPELVGEVKRLSVRPGDHLVLNASERLTSEVVERIRGQFEGLFPGTKLIVLSPGMELSVAEQGGRAPSNTVAFDGEEIARAVARRAEKQRARA